MFYFINLQQGPETHKESIYLGHREKPVHKRRNFCLVAIRQNEFGFTFKLPPSFIYSLTLWIFSSKIIKLSVWQSSSNISCMYKDT